MFHTHQFYFNVNALKRFCRRVKMKNPVKEIPGEIGNGKQNIPWLCALLNNTEYFLTFRIIIIVVVFFFR